MPPVFDKDKCAGCGLCEELCPADAIYTRVEGGERIVPYVKYPDECWHCGSCRQDCPVKAIEIVFPPEMLVI